MTEIAERLHDALGTAPMTRQTLCAIIGVSDRKLRRAINELRENRVPVCSNNRVAGYWLGDEEDRHHTANELRAKALDMLRQADAIDGIESPAQLRFDI